MIDIILLILIFIVLVYLNLNIETFNTNTYPNQNQDELISSIAKYNNVQQDNILIYAGSDEALKDIFTIFLDSSKSCLVKVPTYTQVFTYILPNTSNIIIHTLNITIIMIVIQ